MARPFTLTVAQRTQLDAEPAEAGKTVLLQQFHQQHCWDTWPVVGVWGSRNPVAFTKRWLANEADHMAEAREAYNGEPELDVARPAGSTSFWGMAA